MADGYGAAYAIGILLAFLLLAFALAVAVVLAVLSRRWARRGDSFVALAFPASLPLWGIVCAAFVQGPSSVHYGPAIPVWVGICTLAAVLIMGRALWLRPGADLGSAAVRRSRQWEITVTAVGAGFLYVLWVGAGLRTEYQFAQRQALYSQQQAASAAAADARNAAWSEGRIVCGPQALCYSPDGKYLATADDWVKVWDLATGRVHRLWEDRMRGPGAPRRLYGFDQSGTRFALGSGDELDLFDLSGDRKRLPPTGHGHEVRFLSAQNAVVVLHNKKATVFDLQTGQPVNLPIAALQEPGIAALAVSGDGSQLATRSSERNRIAAWTISGSQPSWTASDVEPSRPTGFAFSADGRWLALATRQKQIIVWNAASGSEQSRLEAGRMIRHLAFASDGSQIVAISTESEFSTGGAQVHVWSLPAGLTIATHALPVSNVNVMALSHDGQEVAIVDMQYGSSQYLPATVRRFATATGVERRGFPASPP